MSAAASLNNALTRYGADFRTARVRLSFGGSDALAAQIEQGARPDVFASASTALPDALYAKHLVARPVVFATNRLVLAVPTGATRVRALTDVARPGTKVVIGAAGVPVGAYTRKLLARLATGEARAILANVRSDEPDVEGVVAKLAAGAADAGFVYVTDVVAAAGRLRAIDLPALLRPRVAYAAAVVAGAPHPAQARAFVAGLLRGAGQRDLRGAGFEPPPR